MVSIKCWYVSQRAFFYRFYCLAGENCKSDHLERNKSCRMSNSNTNSDLTSNCDTLK